MEIQGRLTKKFDTQVVSDKFKKREFVLTIEESSPYPQPLLIQLVQDKVTLMDAFNEDDEIKVHFNLRGRQWDGPQGTKWFNTVDAWRVELVFKGNGGTTTATTQPAKIETPVQNNQPDNNDLPY